MNNEEKEIDELLTSLANLCHSCQEANAVANMLYRQHRTHQQSLGRFFQAAVRVFAKMYEEGYYDLRNEATCQMCNAIKDRVDKFALPFI